MSECKADVLSRHAAPWSDWQLLACHLAALAMIGMLRFAVNFDSLLSGSDGAFATFSQYPGILFTDLRSIISISPYFGFGSNFAGPSPYFDPLGLMLHATGSAVAAYTIFTLIFFLSVYVLARSLGTGAAIATGAAWLLVVLLMPLWRSQIFLADIFSMIHPTSTYVIALFCFVVSLFLLAGTRGPWGNAVIALGFAALMIASWLNNLTFMVLALPFLAGILIVITVTSGSLREFAWKVGCLAVASGLFSLLDVGAYLDSFSAYSRRLESLYGHPDAISPAIRTYLMNLIADKYYQIAQELYGAPLLGWLGMAGLIHGILMGNQRWRLLCLAGFGFMVALTLVSAEFALDGIIWPWAAPSYFERPAFPFYAIAGAIVVGEVSEFVLAPLIRWTSRRPRVAAVVARPDRLQALVLACGVAGVTIATFASTSPTALADRLTRLPGTWPSSDSPWRAVAQLVPVAPNRPFAGWFLDLAPAEYGRTGGTALVDNVGIWRNGGGTLFEIGPEVTLQMDALERLRHVMRLDRSLALQGAYGLAYARLPPGATTAAAVGGAELDRILPGLRRVRQANLGDFTPTEVNQVDTFPSFQARVVADDIDWRRTVFLDPETADLVGAGLVAARQTAPPLVVTNGLRIVADTDGRSLLLLPRQFSNCYVWQPAPGSTGKVSVVRANMLQLALAFEGSISGTLKFQFRWGGDQTCRARDPIQARALGIVPPRNEDGRFGPIGYYIFLRAQRKALERTFVRAGRSEKARTGPSNNR